MRLSSWLVRGSWVLILLAFSGGASAVDLIVRSDTTIATPATFDNVTVRGPRTLTVNDSLTVLSNMTLESGSKVTQSPGVLKGQILVVLGDMTLQTGSILTQTTRVLKGLILNVTGTLTVQSGARIDLSAMGLWGGGWAGRVGYTGETYDERDSIVSGATGVGRRASGGSYGGRGGGGAVGRPNAPYGLLEDPRHVGAGGAAAYDGYYGGSGGHGGGRATIRATACVVDGSLTANGHDGYGYQALGGGGSGGAIRLDVVGTLSGAGEITANGGNTGFGLSGGGGGGRIAIYYGSMTFPVARISAKGGLSRGGAGTIYLKSESDSLGSVIFGGANARGATPLRTGLPRIKRLTVHGSRIEIDRKVAIVDSLFVGPGSAVLGSSTPTRSLEKSP